MPPGARPEVSQQGRIRPVTLWVLDVQLALKRVAGHPVGRLVRSQAILIIDAGILACGSVVVA
ncbi:hypothetical protein D3C79_1029690 [compost metagenome]